MAAPAPSSCDKNLTRHVSGSPTPEVHNSGGRISGFTCTEAPTSAGASGTREAEQFLAAPQGDRQGELILLCTPARVCCCCSSGCFSPVWPAGVLWLLCDTACPAFHRVCLDTWPRAAAHLSLRTPACCGGTAALKGRAPLPQCQVAHMPADVRATASHVRALKEPASFRHPCAHCPAYGRCLVRDRRPAKMRKDRRSCLLPRCATSCQAAWSAP